MDSRHGLRLAWASSVRNIYQAVVGELSCGDPTRVDPAVQRLKRNLPPPANGVEADHLRQSLAIFTERSARAVHERFHANFPRPICVASPPPQSEAAWVNTRSIDELLDEWQSVYTAWFDRHHTLPPVLRAARILEAQFAEPLTIDTLGQAAGASRTILGQQFTRTFGLTPSDYLARVRVREGLRRLRHRGDSVATAAQAVGYQSENKFYARVRVYTGLTPSRVKELDEAAFEDLLARCVPLMVSPHCARAPMPMDRSARDGM
ncbi:MAG TPA: AraC family transcriptional regulator [Vicinamibacterales bacterium]|nr:AraC family transcriptional regulator [Vicinamibacterales bacterium]